MNKTTYKFGEFLLDLDQKRLLCQGKRVSLQPKVFDMLVYFVERHGELVSRDDLMKAVWADTFVEESNLRFCIHALRKALGKNAEGKDYVETLPKRGYRFTAEIQEKSSEIVFEAVISEEVPPPEIAEKPQTAKRYWLIGILAFSLICLVGLGVAWQRSNVRSQKNSFEIRQLAVLPFESVNANDADFQIGLTDVLITNLSKIKQLKVLPLASVRRFAGQNFEALEAGRELGADAILSGTYRFDGENVRVTIKLLRVAGGETLWLETFEAPRKSGLELENGIALRTAGLFSLKIAEIEDEKSLVNQKLNAEAVQNYLSARKIWRSGELFRRQEMIGLFEKTVQAEPNWALAYASYAEALLTSDTLFVEWDKAEIVAKKAIELDAARAAPHTVLGEIYAWRDGNWEQAEAEFKQAAALNPNHALTFLKYSQLLRIQRRFAEAETELDKAAEIEPFSPLFYCSYCELYAFDNKFEKAIAACNYANQIEPDYWRIRKLLYWIYLERKMYPELGEIILGKLPPDEQSALTKDLANNDLRPYFERQIAETAKRKNPNPITKAMLYLQVGDNEKALDSLETALTQREIGLPAVNADSMFDPIRNEKRFVGIMRKIGLLK